MSREQSYPQWRMRNLDVDLDNFPHDPFHWLRPKRRQGLEPWRPGKIHIATLSTTWAEPRDDYERLQMMPIYPPEVVRATDTAIYKMMGKSNG